MGHGESALLQSHGTDESTDLKEQTSPFPAGISENNVLGLSPSAGTKQSLYMHGIKTQGVKGSYDGLEFSTSACHAATKDAEQTLRSTQNLPVLELESASAAKDHTLDYSEPFPSSTFVQPFCRFRGWYLNARIEACKSLEGIEPQRKNGPCVIFMHSK